MTLAGPRRFATALPLGLTASRLTHSCAYHGLRLCFILVPRCGLDSRGGCPHTHERSRRECPTHTSLLIKPVCSSSLDDGGRELQQRRCGRAALLGPHSGAHERWPPGPVHGCKPNTLLCQRTAAAPLAH